MEAMVSQAKETDFAAYAKLSESEQEALEQALASIPDDILSTGDRQWIETRIRNHLQREGILGTGDGVLGITEVPPIAYVGRALACLAANYTTLQGISNNQSADKVAASLARTIAGCVSGNADEIKTDILEHRSRIGHALDALRLPALRAALLAGDPPH